MLIKLIASFLSVLMTALSIPTGFAESIFSSFSGIPIADSSISEEFIDDIDSSDVSVKGGYYKNMIILFIDGDVSVFEKYDILKDYGLKLLGWCCWADAYVAYCPQKTSAEISSLGKKMMDEKSKVLYAGFIPYSESSADTTPDDPFNGSNWDESFPSGANGHLEAIQAREAWNYSEYFSKIKVGVVDSGFNTNHEDLQGRISFPSRSSKNRNRPDYHGTCVAGIIAAEHNNGIGTAGVADNAELLCVDWEPDEDQNWNTTLHIFFGTCRLIRKGAKIINLSIGTSAYSIESGNEEKEKDAYGKIYSTAVSVLIGRGYNFLIVQSAGNGDNNANAVDASYNGHFSAIDMENCNSICPGVSKQDILDRILIVGAVYYNSIEDIYKFTSFSNTGKNVNICAPGRSVYGPDVDDDGYRTMSGTSSAAPIVSGVAALVWSVNPSLKGNEVKRILVENVSHYASSDYEEADNTYPMVNAKLSVEAAINTKYSTCRVTCDIDSDYTDSDDCAEISINEKNKIITAPKGHMDLIIEKGDVKIKIIGSEGYDFDEITFSSGDEDINLGDITPVSLKD